MTVNVLASLKSRLLPFLDAPAAAQAADPAQGAPDFSILMGKQIAGAPLPLNGVAGAAQATTAATAMALPGVKETPTPGDAPVATPAPIIGVPDPALAKAGSPAPLDRPAATQATAAPIARGRSATEATVVLIAQGRPATEAAAALLARGRPVAVGAPPAPETPSPDQAVPDAAPPQQAVGVGQATVPVGPSKTVADEPEIALYADGTPAPALATVARKILPGQAEHVAADVAVKTLAGDEAVGDKADEDDEDDQTVMPDRGRTGHAAQDQINPNPAPASAAVGTPIALSPIASPIQAPPASADAIVSSTAAGAARGRPTPDFGASSGRPSAPLGEATALLRLLSAPAQTGEEAKTTDAGRDLPLDSTSISMPSAGSAIAPSNPSPLVLSPVDLSASLGQRVIDMSSGGQWIDGLAKEIATLAAGSGQGAFRLSPENLGPMRVDVRNGAAGVEVRLTVETEAAKIALDKDSDRLKDDNRLAAVRIADVTVERVQRIAEHARSEATAGQNSGNNPPPNQQNAAQMAFGQGQASGHQPSGQQAEGKTSPNAAVLSHAEPQDPDVDDSQSALRHARYA